MEEDDDAPKSCSASSSIPPQEAGAPPPPPGALEERPKGSSLRSSIQSSIRPSAPPPGLGSGPSHNYRILFAALWVLVQATLVITADRRMDGAFGFRMSNESSTIKLALYREVDDPSSAPPSGHAGQSTRVHVDGGVWSAEAADGSVHRHTWYDRVPMPYWVFDREMHTSYGASTQLDRLQSALDDVASHVPDDTETRRFILEVTVRKNGREPVVYRLMSRERVLPSSHRPIDRRGAAPEAGTVSGEPGQPQAHEDGGP